MQTLIFTSDRYLKALKAGCWLYNKYFRPTWDHDTVICGFTPPDFELPDNFRFHSIGDFTHYPFGRWSDAVIKALNEVANDVFLFLLEDYWLTRAVDMPAIRILYDYMIQFEYVAKIDLVGDRLYAHGADLNYGTVGHLDLIKSMPGSPYHLSLMAGLWRKDHLLRHLIPGENPHQVEMVGTQRMSHDRDAIILGTRQWPLRHTLALRSGNPDTEFNIGDLDPGDVEVLRELGYL